jgi:hypothetical protein
MPKVEFILQGLTARTHGSAVKELFDVEDIKSVILSIAFITEDGVRQIESELTSQAKTLTVFAGIRTANCIGSEHSLLTRKR